MTEKRPTSRHQIAPPSPLEPYRNIIERNPIEDHFTDKQLQKHMRHVGLKTKSSNNKSRDPTSLDRDEHEIQNSGREKRKRFRRKFITAMVDTIQEVDRARQAEFRNQLELWDKMYSNRVQRIKAYNGRLERKYGLFVDREMKKELIRENLSKMPEVPSISIPRINLDYVPNQSINRAMPVKPKRNPSAPPLHQHVNEARSRLDELTERLTKLDNDFLTFLNQDFHDCRIDVDLLKANIETLINSKNMLHEEVNKLKSEIEELQTDLNEIVKDQDMMKIIQLEHEEKISQLNILISTFEKIWQEFKNIREEQENTKQILQTEDKRQQNQIDQIFDHLKQLDSTNIIQDFNSKLQILSTNHGQLTKIQDQIRTELDIEKNTIKNLDEYYKKIIEHINSIEVNKTDLVEHNQLLLEFKHFKDNMNRIENYLNTISGKIQTLETNKVNYDEDTKTKNLVNEQQKSIDRLQNQHPQFTDNQEKPIVIDNSDQIESLQLQLQNNHQFYSSKIEILENEISTIKNNLKTSPTSPILYDNNYEKDFKKIQNKQEQFDNSLRNFTENIENLQKSIISAHDGITQINNTINNQQQQFEKMIHDNINTFEQQIMMLREEFRRTINQEINKVKEESTVLKTRVENLEAAINGLKLPHIKKKDALPYVEKLPPVDLIEINWLKYQRQN